MFTTKSAPSFFARFSLASEISKTVTVLSSALDGLTKTVRNVYIEQMPIDFSNETEKMIHGLDVLQNFSTIQDINYSAFIKFSKELAAVFDMETFEKIISVKNYKKSTISFLREILDFYNVKNDLNKYLSALSEYKHPKMKEISEIAKVDLVVWNRPELRENKCRY